ncbi:MAG: hypothetical protein EOM91_10350 [Sphingobacteriia bacterium]|jgi:DNA-binding protein H-NS|nr:hypothetical protein [Sphingobacteriia bacterium]
MTEDTVDLATLRSELGALEDRRSELQRMILATRRKELRAFCAELRELVKDRGHDLTEVVDELTRRRSGGSRRSAGASGERSAVALNEDPSLIYIRGVMPDWMKQKMLDAGMDPKSRTDRARFRSEHMHPVESDH